jgi:glucose/arabinose dehydrogenase
MLFLGNHLYVATTDGVTRYPYKIGQTKVGSKGEKILELPVGGYNNHWTRNLISSLDGKKIFVTVGSGSDHGEYGMEQEQRRADILEINPDGSGERIFASGLRNPVGVAFEPKTHALWTAVNERDELGDELVPDYMTEVHKGGFYGWPYLYWGNHEDPRWKGKIPSSTPRNPLVPDFALGNHTASLGLAFYTGTAFPKKYQNGAFIGQHGSWNSSVLRGYNVYFVPFKDGRPEGPGEVFLSGFIADPEKKTVYGRPVTPIMLMDGSLLVADDVGQTIWRVRWEG